jgi:two-component system, OmpR family, sensor histidine kinase ChvG
VLIRTKLLLLGLATLALPWAGCQYVREVEGSLRLAESQSLLAVARTIATSLRGRRDLLFRGVDDAHPGEPTGPYDFEPLPLASTPQLDGRDDDWPAAKRATRRFSSRRPGEMLEVRTATHERHLYLLVGAPGDRLVVDASDAAALDPAASGDRVWIAYTTPEGEPAQLFVSGWNTGAVRGRRVATRELGRPELVEEPRVQGAWRNLGKPDAAGRGGGWMLELRMPLSMLGRDFGVLLDDRDARGEAPSSYGSLAPRDLAPRGRLFAAAPELAAYLAQFSQPGVRIAAATPTGAVLAEANALTAVDAGISGSQALLSQLYRRLLGGSSLAQRPAETERGRLDAQQVREVGAGQGSTAVFGAPGQQRLLVAAAAPVLETGSDRVIAMLQVTQTADRWLLLRDRALTRLLNLTLLAVAIVVGAILLFGARLALRLERVRRASDAALTRDGQLRSEFPETAAADELGDVARGFSALLARLGEYTGYLRTLAGKLSHEIRTPLTIVRSSLENLESEPLSAAARTYVARAREGSDRLGAIVQAMGAATRVEESIRSAERSRFDLANLLETASAAYRDAFPARAFAVDGTASPCEVVGAPDLVLQMLDKLVDNAVDFSPPGSTVRLRLRDGGGPEVAIEVENEGPSLPPDAGRQLFESLWQHRRGDDGRPHFGLGLYIVKLITDFHGGSAQAEDRADPAGGVRFTIRLSRNLPEV